MAVYIWQRRGRVTAIILALFAAVFIFMQARYSSPVLATSDGSAYAVPQVVDINSDPDIVETTITADESTVNIGGPAGGVMPHVLTFNGTMPGPEFRLKVGDTVIVHYENHMDHASGIHWHGIELNNHSDGTPLTQNMVPPMGSYLYKFKVTRPGIYWYHPHHHSSTNQVFKGLYGSIIVTDPNEGLLIAAGRIPGSSSTLTLALSDITVCRAPGSNPSANPSPLPHVSGGDPGAQGGPTPKFLCEAKPAGGAIDEDGNDGPSFLAGDVPNIQKAGSSGQVNEGQTVLTNGIDVGGRAGTPSSPGALSIYAETHDVAAGQGLRLQIGNTATTRFFRLRLTDADGTLIPLVKIGGQGGLLDNAVVLGDPLGRPASDQFIFGYALGEVLLDPGDRMDVVAAIPADASPFSVLTLWTEDFQRTGLGYAKIPTVPVAHFQVSLGRARTPFTIAAGDPLRCSCPGGTYDPVEVLGLPTATLIDPSTFGWPGMESTNIELTNPGKILGINGVQGEHDDPGVDYTAIKKPDSTRWARLGDRLELLVTNVTSAHHPFHLHGFAIQPIVLANLIGGAGLGTAYTFPHEFVDNINIPPNFTLLFRVRLDDRPQMDGVTAGGGLGRWVFHCHIFFHASFGMISELDVVHGLAQPRQRPHIRIPDYRDIHLFVHPADPVTVHGTYVDTNGEGIALSASLGSIIDDGGGRWTWTHIPRRGESGFVYLTITDAGGRTDQVALALNVDDAFNRVPDCDAATAVGNIGPPNHQMVPISVGGVTDPDADSVKITITAIRQDEPTNENGGRNFCPDGEGVGGPVAQVRAERTGDKKNGGNGRVYHIFFTATDPLGASCSGVVKAGVPHDQGGSSTPIDDGPLYDSGQCPAGGNDKSKRDQFARVATR